MNDEAPPPIVLTFLGWYIVLFVVAALAGWWFL